MPASYDQERDVNSPAKLQGGAWRECTDAEDPAAQRPRPGIAAGRARYRIRSPGSLADFKNRADALRAGYAPRAARCPALEAAWIAGPPGSRHRRGPRRAAYGEAVMTTRSTLQKAGADLLEGAEYRCRSVSPSSPAALRAANPIGVRAGGGAGP